MLKIKLIILFALLLSGSLMAQDAERVLQRLNTLEYTASLPDEILQNKSIALVQVPPKSTNPVVRGDWQKLAEQAQPGFKRAGIDVVTYYYIDDIFSGKETLAAFIKDFKGREFENVVFLVQEGASHRIVLTKINDDNHLISQGQPAWETQHSSLAKAMDNLYKAASSAEQVRENLLILEIPEFGLMTKPITARRGEYYDVNFSSEKLAVPMFADTAKINQAMANYPYKFGVVDPDLDEKDVRAKGYQYILYYVHTSAKAVKDMLEYPTKDTETAYVSEVVKDGKARVNSYSINTPVYKFYIKHIYSGNVFLGKKWDAAPTWEEALDNFNSNLRTELIR